MCVNWNELQYLACATSELQPVATATTRSVVTDKCYVTTTGAIALGKGLQENNSLEELEYVTNTLSFA